MEFYCRNSEFTRVKSISGVIIHYHVGENHFVREFNDELGSDTLNTNPKNEAGPVNLTRSVSKSLLKYKSSNFFYDAGSNSLKFGRETFSLPLLQSLLVLTFE